MNTKQAREIPIEKVLEKMNITANNTIGDEIWYLSPFRTEKTPSFKLNLKNNRWYDFGEQQGGNCIDLIVFKFGFSISEALEYLSPLSENLDFSFQKQESNLNQVIDKKISINKVVPISHNALIQYFESRKIKVFKNIIALKEIHYSINDKNYFAIGFQNKSDGFEIRSKYVKICLGKKDITIVSNGLKTLRIFEGFFDYLSFIQIREKLNKVESDYLILNSVALIVKNISILENYEKIELYLDGDESGNKYANFIKNKFENATDCKEIYFGFNDLNDWLTFMG